MSVMIRKKSTARRGITLIEILICIGILAFSLLGVVALIPVGHFAVVETTKADRSTACAKAAKVSVRLHNMLDTSNWRRCEAGAARSYQEDLNDDLTDPAAPDLLGHTVIIDPLGVTVTTASSWNFPYSSPLILRRYTTSGLLNWPELSERLCRWEDDVIIDVDDSDADLRPRQTYVFDTGEFAPYPIRDGENISAGAIPMVRQSKGDYTWFLTVTPDITEVNAGSRLKTFEVSTVVCFKRSLSFSTADVPAERVVEVNGFSGISGGGAADLALIAPSSLTTDEDRLEYLKIKKGQWLMLVGQETIGLTTRTIARWYQVQTVDDEMNGNDRWITVSGPEWDRSVITGTHAILVDDVIGVFTETMTAE